MLFLISNKVAYGSICSQERSVRYKFLSDIEGFFSMVPIEEAQTLEPFAFCGGCGRTGAMAWRVIGDYICAWCRING